LASRNWRAFGGATATALALGVAAAIAFGRQTWPAFIASLFDRNAGLSPQPGVRLSLESVYGLLHLAGAPAWFAIGAHATVAFAVAVAVYAVWAKPYPAALKAALLSVASLLLSPYVLLYDLCILSIAVAFLISDGLSRGFLAGERMTMPVSLLPLYFAAVPLGAVSCAILLFLILRRIAAGDRLQNVSLTNG
jgi:Glycosyltransferase family 87